MKLLKEIEKVILRFNSQLDELNRTWKVVDKMFLNERDVLLSNPDMIKEFGIIDNEKDEHLFQDVIFNILEIIKNLLYVNSFTYFEVFLNDLIEVLFKNIVNVTQNNKSPSLKINGRKYFIQKMQKNRENEKIEFICKTLKIDKKTFSILDSHKKIRNLILHNNSFETTELESNTEKKRIIISSLEYGQVMLAMKSISETIRNSIKTINQSST